MLFRSVVKQRFAKGTELEYTDDPLVLDYYSFGTQVACTGPFILLRLETSCPLRTVHHVIHDLLTAETLSQN